SSMSRRIQPEYPRIPCITPSWDNSPRCRQRATVFIESSPALFQQWAANTLAKLKNSRNIPPILFINAWNEWAEGNHLEPDQRYGRSYLEALREALRSVDGG
ncbi:MAG: glycosyl hydrolase, partial [Verrucomicrobia bacterium]